MMPRQRTIYNTPAETRISVLANAAMAALNDWQRGAIEWQECQVRCGLALVRSNDVSKISPEQVVRRVAWAAAEAAVALQGDVSLGGRR